MVIKSGDLAGANGANFRGAKRGGSKGRVECALVIWYGARIKLNKTK